MKLKKNRQDTQTPIKKTIKRTKANLKRVKRKVNKMNRKPQLEIPI